MKTPRQRLISVLTLGLALLASACSDNTMDTASAAEPAPRTLALINAQVFRGTDAPVIDNGALLIEDGRIVEVAQADALRIPAHAEVVDLQGRWLLPGFINAHGHVNPEGDRASIAEQLDIYAHYGVTTVLSLGDEGTHMEGDRWGASLTTARLFVSGPSLRPGSEEEAAAEVARVAEMGVDWVKMHVTENWGRDYFPYVIGAADREGLPSAIHIETLVDAKAVLRAGASLLGHSVRDEAVDQALIDQMREREVCLTPTLTRELSTFVYAERPDFFDDPFFLERSAPDDIEAFLTPERREQARSPQAEYWREALPLAKSNLLALHEAGAGIAMGTDSGPTGRFQGYFEHLEMAMMVEAGMTPEDVLKASTSEAARCIGLDDRIGTIAPGLWADLVVLDADPLADIANTREIHGVWIAGNRVR